MPRGPQPLLVDIHGGPHNAWNGAADEMHLYHQELAARGWAVLLVNPRGSDGYGEAFYNAALGAWGEADAKDFLEPIDELVAEGLADPAAPRGHGLQLRRLHDLLPDEPRRPVRGSGGGRCRQPTSPLRSASRDLGHYLGALELGVQPWEARGRYEELSPIGRVEHVRTPTLVLPRRDRHPLPHRAGRSTGSRHSARAECRLNSFSTLTHPIYSSWRDSCRIAWTSTDASSAGCSSTPAARAAPP